MGTGIQVLSFNIFTSMRIFKKQDEVLKAPTIWLKYELAERELRENQETELREKTIRDNQERHRMSSWVPAGNKK